MICVGKGKGRYGDACWGIQGELNTACIVHAYNRAAAYIYLSPMQLQRCLLVTLILLMVLSHTTQLVVKSNKQLVSSDIVLLLTYGPSQVLLSFVSVVHMT